MIVVMAFVCTLASGSSGNCVLISHMGTHILVDAGISRKRLNAALGTWGLSAADLAAVLVTHEHSDHTSGLPYLRCPAYTGIGTAGYLNYKGVSPCVREISDFGQFEIGSVGVTPFPVPHDAPDTLGFLVHMGSKTVCVCTDLGHMDGDTLAMCAGADYLLLEANHDVAMLRAGSYPAALKMRILGPRGHLSNDASAEAVLAAVRARSTRVTLCHLSQDNNTPPLALETVSQKLSAAGVRLGRDLLLDTAPRLEPGVPWGQFA